MPTPPMSSKPALARRQTLTKNSMDDTYESGDVIGTGSFGIIRKVTRKADGIVLACKELNYGRMDERDLRQLTEEVNILEQLGSNDNIVRYHERFVDKPNNMLYILMEYCEGGDLAGVIQRCRNSGTLLSEDVVWAYLSQITLALFDCHSEVDVRGGRKAVILHRDIKPENVFLDKDNNLKLGDFGLSKAMAQAAMTQTYVGTPYYMSPELINGQPYDVKSDIWALGCLIYELCAGHPPFHEARTQPELAIMIREGKIPDLPKAYTAHLGQVVKAMLKQNPKHRPTTTQIKALDNVKLQIRAIELRRATKDLRIRDAQIILRETDLLSREAAVLLRERAVSAREENVRVGTESLKEAHANLRAERWRPSTSKEEENRPPVAAVPTEVRVASRRPLEDRRTSQIPQPFQRLPSMGSLMSLCGDTPGRSIPPTSARRKLASKSMYDLSALSTTLSTPSRPSIPFPSSRPIVESPMNVEDQYGSTSESAVSTPSKPLRLSRAPPTNALRRAISTTNIISSGYSLPPTPISQTYVDDLPSPFLKKQPSSSAVGVPVRGTRMSMGGRPSMSSRLLATRASAQKGFEEVGRRIGEKIGT